MKETLAIFENLIVGGEAVIANTARELASLLDISPKKARTILDTAAEQNLATKDSRAKPEKFNIPFWYWEEFHTFSNNATTIYASKMINLAAMNALFTGLHTLELNGQLHFDPSGNINACR